MPGLVKTHVARRQRIPLASGVKLHHNPGMTTYYKSAENFA